MEHSTANNVLELLLYEDRHKNLIHNALFRHLEKGYIFGPHCHQNVELCLMLQGRCDIIINGDAVTVHSHEYMILFSNVIHSFHVPDDTDCEFLQLHFSPDVFLHLNPKIYGEQRFLYYISTGTQQFLKNRFTEGLRSCAERIEREVNSDKTNHIAIANLYIYEMILLLSREIEQSFAPQMENCHPAVTKAIQYIHEHLGEKLNLDSIARECSLSKRYLMKLFHDSLHVTVNDYINLIRINRAMEELSSGDKCNLTLLADRLGFSSVQYFTTVFKKYAGVTPKKYCSLNTV